MNLVWREVIRQPSTQVLRYLSSPLYNHRDVSILGSHLLVIRAFVGPISTRTWGSAVGRSALQLSSFPSPPRKSHDQESLCPSPPHRSTTLQTGVSVEGSGRRFGTIRRPPRAAFSYQLLDDLASRHRSAPQSTCGKTRMWPALSHDLSTCPCRSFAIPSTAKHNPRGTYTRDRIPRSRIGAADEPDH